MGDGGGCVCKCVGRAGRVFARSSRLEKLHASSAVNAKDLAIDPVSVLGCEEAHNARNVDRLSYAVARRPGGCVFVDLVVGEFVAIRNVFTAYSVVHVGLDATRRDAVDGNLLVAAI